MISVVLNGGLGNQLFQIFAGAALAIKTNRKLVCKHIDARRDCANGKLFFVKPEPSINFKDFKEPREFEVCSSFPFLQTESIRLHGYFQHKNYFDMIFDECAKLISFPAPTHQYPGTAIHVRRTDYKNLAHIYVQLSKDYYVSSIQDMPRPFTIVTDECDAFVHDLAKTLSAEIRSNDTYSDFAFLCGHQNVVCANSTFSWWAGYLVKRRGGTVIVPKVFLRNGKTIEL